MDTKTIEMYCVNWNDGQNCYMQYKMYVDEILLAMMFIRFYFLIDSVTLLAPINQDLNGKRIIKDLKLESNLKF